MNKPSGYTSAIAVLFLLQLSACSHWAEDSGVDNHWRSADIPSWQAGVSSNQDILEALGPPSQILNIVDQVMYYYLRANTKGSKYFALVYSASKSTTQYDRAIFFFDTEGLLIRYSYSKEALPYTE